MIILTSLLVITQYLPHKKQYTSFQRLLLILNTTWASTRRTAFMFTTVLYDRGNVFDVVTITVYHV